MSVFEIQGWRLLGPSEAAFDFVSDGEPFVEHVQFTTDLTTKTPILRDALLDTLAAALGVSYFKLAPRNRIAIRRRLPEIARPIVEDLYTDGLGEFFVRNALPYPPDLTFDFAELYPVEPQSADAASAGARPALTPFGGGKDSYVTLDLLAKAGIESELFSVFISAPQRQALEELAPKPPRFVKRVLDPKIFDKSRKALSGHVPITGMISLIALIDAVDEYSAVVFSNEMDASEPTMIIDGREINHQFSKSLAFERRLRTLTEALGPAAPQYFSALRPVREAWIAAYMAQHLPESHQRFSSCNRLFRADRPTSGAFQRWCGACAKCIYTATIIGPHLSREGYDRIFPKTIFTARANEAELRKIVGLEDQKPWDCVGNQLDAAASLAALYERADFSDAPLIQQVGAELVEKYGAAFLRTHFDAAQLRRAEHCMPQELEKRLFSSAAL